MSRPFVPVAFVVVGLFGCSSEDPLKDTRPTDSGYDVVEVAITDTGTVSPTDSDVPPTDTTAGDVASEVSTDTGTAPADSAGGKPLTVTPAGDSTRRGSSSGTLFNDDCPSGQVPTGIVVSMGTGAIDGTVGNLRTLCSKTNVTTDRVVLSPGDTLPPTGNRGTATTVGAPVTVSCPANQVIVGFDGRESSSIHALGLVCAPLVVSGGSASVGATSKVAPVGSTTAGAPFATTLCPGFQLAYGVSVNAAAVINGFALRCASL